MVMEEKSYKKYLPTEYKTNAPRDKPKVTKRVPSHFPNTKPPIKPTGLPNPNKNTHAIVKIQKNNIRKKKLLSFNSLSLSVLDWTILILLKSWKLNFENKKNKNEETAIR